MQDKLGQELAVGDFVATATSYHSGLGVGKIEKFTPQKILIIYVGKRGSKYSTPDQVIKLTGEAVFEYAMKKGV